MAPPPWWPPRPRPPPPPPPHSHLTAASTLSLALLVALFCFPPAHARVRAAARPAVVSAVRSGLPAVAALQARSTPALTTLFTAVSATVSVPFYATALPAVVWCADAQLGARLALLLALALYVGNAAKDLVCAPRPFDVGGGAGSRRRPIKLLTSVAGSEDESAAEHGFPSSHVANTVVMTLYALHYATRTGLLPGGWVGGARCAVAVWAVAVGAARCYMGMHAPVDIAGGALLGLLLASAWSAVDDAYFGWLAGGGARAAGLHTLATAVLLRLHPLPVAHTSSFEASTAFAGAGAGVAAGVASGGLALLSAPASGALAAARVAAGLAVVAAAKAASKRVAALIVPLPYRAVPLAVRRLWQPPLHSAPAHARRAARTRIPVDAAGTPWDEIMTTRFFAYAGLGWAVADAAPRLFRWAGL